MGLFTELDASEARRLGAEFGLDVARLEPLSAGSVNSNFRFWDASGRPYFARVYEEQGARGAEVEVRLLTELARAGLPVAEPLPLRAGGLVATTAGKPFALYHWVDGEALCQGRVTPLHCAAVGRALAQLHRTTPSLTKLTGGRFRIEDLISRLDRIDKESPAHRDAVLHIRRRLEHYAERRPADLPSGVIHGDLFRDNVLWHGTEIVALLDFESASSGPFAFDVMVTLEAWCYRDSFDHALIAALLSGYEEIRSLETSERDALLIEGAIAALRFATTRITDFSMRAAPGEPPARDYRRFLARLEELEGGALDRHLAKGRNA